MKTWIKGFVAGGAFALAVPAFAADTMQHGSMDTGTKTEKTTKMEKTSKTEMGKSAQYPGVIKDVDADKKMVTLQVPLAPSATIMKDGQKVSLADIKEGDDVRASFDPKTHKIVRLDVQSSDQQGSQDQMNKDMNKGSMGSDTTKDTNKDTNEDMNK